MKDAKQNGLTPIALIFYDSGLSFLYCFAAWLVNADERSGAAEYLGSQPGLAALVLGVSSLMAMLYNVASFTLTKVTSSLTSAIVGASTKIAVIACSAAFIERDHSVLNWIATFSFFGTLCLYVYDRVFPPKPAADGQAKAS